MYTYTAYGLLIISEFCLPELEAADCSASSADVTYRRGDVEPVADDVEGSGMRRISANPGRCRLTYESYGTFLVQGGTDVVFDPASTDVVETKIVRRLLENEILAVLLHQRERLVLHASAVAIDGSAVVFLGPRGIGKSTMAAAFHVSGYPIIEDDMVSIRLEDGVPMVDQGVPEMRLTPDAVEALGIEGASKESNDGGSGKLYYQFTQSQEPKPLMRCYVLDTGELVSIDGVPEEGEFFNLITHTYTQGLVSDTQQSGSHFELCSSITESTEFRLLSRPKEYEKLQSVIDAVVADLSVT